MKDRSLIRLSVMISLSPFSWKVLEHSRSDTWLRTLWPLALWIKRAINVHYDIPGGRDKSGHANPHTVHFQVSNLQLQWSISNVKFTCFPGEWDIFD